MSATLQRDQAADLAKASPAKALEKARGIAEPWFRAQALAWVARFSPGETPAIAKEAAKAASACDDTYKQAAVRAWEIAALAETGAATNARKSLGSAVELAKKISHSGSRAEALLLLCHAADKIGRETRDQACTELISACPDGAHWRCKRAVRDAKALLEGRLEARPFFW
jgi:hypothetical protein